MTLQTLRRLPGGANLLERLPERAAHAVIIGCAHALAERPGSKPGEITAIANQAWQTIRSQRFDGSGVTVEAVMSRAGYPGSTYEIERVVRVLYGARGLRATLLEQRQQIDALLAIIEAVDAHPVEVAS